eukprot:jgi/Undpi1/12875/HiC_scaffold_7.g02542.m1
MVLLERSVRDLRRLKGHVDKGYLSNSAEIASLKEHLLGNGEVSKAFWSNTEELGRLRAVPAVRTTAAVERLQRQLAGKGGKRPREAAGKGAAAGRTEGGSTLDYPSRGNEQPDGQRHQKRVTEGAAWGGHQPETADANMVRTPEEAAAEAAAAAAAAAAAGRFNADRDTSAIAGSAMENTVEVGPRLVRADAATANFSALWNACAIDGANTTDSDNANTNANANTNTTPNTNTIVNINTNIDPDFNPNPYVNANTNAHPNANPNASLDAIANANTNANASTDVEDSSVDVEVMIAEAVRLAREASEAAEVAKAKQDAAALAVRRANKAKAIIKQAGAASGAWSKVAAAAAAVVRWARGASDDAGGPIDVGGGDGGGGGGTAGAAGAASAASDNVRLGGNEGYPGVTASGELPKVIPGTMFEILGTPEETWANIWAGVKASLARDGHTSEMNVRRIGKLAGRNSRWQKMDLVCRCARKCTGSPKVEDVGRQRQGSSAKCGCTFKVKASWNKTTLPRLGKVCLKHVEGCPAEAIMISEKDNIQPEVVEQECEDAIRCWALEGMSNVDICRSISARYAPRELGATALKKVLRIVSRVKRDTRSTLTEVKDSIAASKLVTLGPRAEGQETSSGEANELFQSPPVRV